MDNDAKQSVRYACKRRQRAEQAGFIYMIRSGSFYKIGKTNAAGRRERELAIKLPERTSTHHIKTNDPAGIEACWHKWFEAKRRHGEWFELDTADIQAFKGRVTWAAAQPISYRGLALVDWRPAVGHG